MITAVQPTDNKSISTKTNSRLAKSEAELSEVMGAEFQAFYRQGEILERILRDREFTDFGFSSFDDYLTDRKPLGIQRRHAWRLIAAKQLIERLEKVADCPRGQWTEKSLRPLTHKAFTPLDQIRIAKKVFKRVKNGELLTARLVQSFCDYDRGVPQEKERQTNERIEQEFEAASVETHLDNLGAIIFKYQFSLRQVDVQQRLSISKKATSQLKIAFQHLLDLFDGSDQKRNEVQS